MPSGKDINIKETDADSKQNGIINNSISGNSVETTMDFIQLHFNFDDGSLGTCSSDHQTVLWVENVQN